MAEMSPSVKEKIGALSKDRADLLRLLSQAKSQQESEIRSHPRSEGASFRTSSSQTRLWFIDQLGGGSAAYNISVAIRLVGVLDPAVLQNALDALVQRHEALRTVWWIVGRSP
jgi:hypothetical protein